MHLRGFLRAGHTPTLLCAFGYFDVSFMVWLLLAPLAVFIAEDFGLEPEGRDAARVGLMLAVPLLGGALLRLVLGVLTDHVGPRRTGLLGLLQWSHVIASRLPSVYEPDPSLPASLQLPSPAVDVLWTAARGAFLIAVVGAVAALALRTEFLRTTAGRVLVGLAILVALAPSSLRSPGQALADFVQIHGVQGIAAELLLAVSANTLASTALRDRFEGMEPAARAATKRPSSTRCYSRSSEHWLITGLLPVGNGRCVRRSAPSASISAARTSTPHNLTR